MIYTVISDLTLSEDLSDKLQMPSSRGVEVFSCLSNERMPICSIVDGEGKRAVNNSASERDCCILRQPLSLLPEGVRAYIKDTGSSSVRSERCLAYTTLLSSLAVFFGVTASDIRRTPDGKPYLVLSATENCENGQSVSYEQNSSDIDGGEYKNADGRSENYCSPLYRQEKSTVTLPCSAAAEKYQKNEDYKTEKAVDQKNKDLSATTQAESEKNKAAKQICISISHSNGVIAVSLSDEGEVGVDIQGDISPDRAARLDKRFFSTVQAVGSKLNVEYYLCKITENEAKFEKISLTEPKTTDFNSKWVFCESVMKLHGRGFGDISRLPDLVGISSTELRMYSSTTDFTIATSIKSQ